MEFGYTYTIIIPHKNIQPLLRRCLNSIPRRKDIQVIVVDDGSDNCTETEAVVRNAGNAEIVCISGSRGAGRARNIGLRHARGRWIVFADADDFFTDELLPALEGYSDSEFDIVFFDSCSASSETLQPMPKRETSADRFRKSGDYGILRYTSHVVWGKMYSSRFVTENSIVFEEIAACNDYMFSGKAGILAHQIAFDDRVIYCYTVRSNSISTTISLNNCVAGLLARLRLNEMLRTARVPQRYWDNALSPFGDMRKVSASATLRYFGTYLRRTPPRRIGVDTAQALRRIVLRLAGVDKSRSCRKMRKMEH